MAIYRIGTYAMPTTVAPVRVIPGGGINTILQVAPQSSIAMKVLEWGWSSNGENQLNPTRIELLETDVAATAGTAHVESGIVSMDAHAFSQGNPATDFITLGTGATGFNFTTEGSVTDARVLDAYINPDGVIFVKEFSLSQQPLILGGSFLRIRMLPERAFSSKPSVLAYVVVELM